jgi:hypothetical protein
VSDALSLIFTSFSLSQVYALVSSHRLGLSLLKPEVLDRIGDAKERKAVLEKKANTLLVLGLLCTPLLALPLLGGLSLFFVFGACALVYNNKFKAYVEKTK